MKLKIFIVMSLSIAFASCKNSDFHDRSERTSTSESKKGEDIYSGQTEPNLAKDQGSPPLATPSSGAPSSGTKESSGTPASKNFDVTPTDKKGEAGPLPKSVESGSELVIPPTDVSGAWLSCSYEVKSDGQGSDALLGCRVDDSNGVRRPGVSLAPTYRYDYRLDEPLNGLKLVSRLLASDNRYDALFLVQGISNSDLLAKLSRLVIEAVFLDENAGKSLAIEGMVSKILRSTESLPEPRISNYSAAIPRMITDANEGIVTPLALEPLVMAPLDEGARLYATHCESCHGAKGGSPKNVRNSSKENILSAIGATPEMAAMRGKFQITELQAIENFLK